MATELPEEPKSRKEAYLADIAGQDVELPDEPKSREEQYLAYIAENGGGGGGGGTSNFNQLSNRPKYNGTTMTGDTDIPEVKTYTAGSNITISGNEISATDTTYSAGTGLDLTGTSFSVDYTDTQAKLTAGSNITISDNTISATDTTYSNFTGTDGTAAGTAGLVPAPATTDAGKFLKADGTWDTAGGGSSITVLTSADYDYPDNNPTSVAAWRLAPGMYTNFDGTNVAEVRFATGSSIATFAGTTFVIGEHSGSGDSAQIPFVDLSHKLIGYLTANGSSYTKTGIPPVTQTTGTSTTDVMSQDATTNAINAVSKSGSGAPTTSTTGTVGQLYQDTTNGKLYICTAVSGATYTWTEVGAGGSGGPTVVQTTGTSTTDVMSQNAVTSMVFADPSTKNKVQIGNGATGTGSRGIAIGVDSNSGAGNDGMAIGYMSTSNSQSGIAIGYNSYVSTNKPGSIALGAGASVTYPGEVNIGSGTTGFGYNNSQYRLLTGLYDGQSAHDAATKGYVDPTTDSSAPTTATVGRLGQIQIDTTNADAYMCVAVDSVTPSYTWKKISV